MMQTAQPWYQHDSAAHIATVADEPLCHTVLPRTAEAGLLGLNTEGLQSIHDFFVETRRSIKDQITRRGIVGH